MSAATNHLIIPRIDQRLCTGCGLCVQQCPTQAVAVRDGVAVIVRPEACSFCELCERSCPTGAIGRPFTITFAPSTAVTAGPSPAESDRYIFSRCVTAAITETEVCI